jgi:hypothetical protein
MLAIRAYLLVDLQVNAGGYARFISPGSWDATALTPIWPTAAAVGSGTALSPNRISAARIALAG